MTSLFALLLMLSAGLHAACGDITLTVDLIRCGFQACRCSIMKTQMTRQVTHCTALCMHRMLTSSTSCPSPQQSSPGFPQPCLRLTFVGLSSTAATGQVSYIIGAGNRQLGSYEGDIRPEARFSRRSVLRSQSAVLANCRHNSLLTFPACALLCVAAGALTTSNAMATSRFGAARRLWSPSGGRP